MKLAKRILALLAAIALCFSSVAMIVSADEHEHEESSEPTVVDCEYTEEVNVASKATVTGDPTKGYQGNQVHWIVSDHFYAVNDNDPATVCPVDTINGSANFGMFMDFDTPYQLTKLVIQTYGVGRAISSTVATERVSGIFTEYTLHVVIKDASGNEIFSTSRVTTKENMVIELPTNIDRTSQIYIWYDKANGGWGQGIWEVEAYTTEAHTWVDANVDLEPGCTWRGAKTLRCTECEIEDVTFIPMTSHVDTCKGTCDECGATISINHESESCTSTECKKCGETVSSKAHTPSNTDPCDTSCTVCGAEDVIPAPHVHDVTQPCNNDCVKCGAKDVIPDAYDIGAAITRLDWVYPYTYAVHVANPNDACDTTCYSCGRPEAVRAAHVLPDNPCTQTACKNANCYTNAAGYAGEKPFAHYKQGTLVNEPHVRPEPITGNENVADNKSPETNNHACKFNCAECGAQKLGFNHYFTNCGDATCNCCGDTVSLHERVHTFTAESPTQCVDCGTMFKYRVNQEGTITKLYEVTFVLEDEPCTHTYDNDCDVYCNDCNYQRYGWRGPVEETWHIYENVCDADCNFCGLTRTPEHVYPEEECAELCTVCGNKRETTVPHTYSDIVVDGTPLENSSACDTTCDVCNEVRVVSHAFAKPCSLNCSSCGAENTNIQHEYDNDCDEECNNCGEINEDAHTYSATCDTTCNVEGCGATRQAPDAHVWDNACDTDCNRGCGETRTVPAHVYDNKHDNTCNVCGVANPDYIADHAYDNNCDNECNICGAANANYAAHVYGDWTVTKEATTEETGSQTKTCSVCGNAVTEEIPMLEKKGLGGGAIAGIVSGSVIVVIGGGFALYWFVFKKRLG